jgi:AraC-like DNA-binding protein
VPYDQELIVLDMVRNGDVDALKSFPFQTMFSHKSHLSDNPIRQKKYEFVSTVAVQMRVAIEGGLDMETAYSLSDSFIRMIDRLEDMDAILAVFKRVPFEFAKRVRDSRKRQLLSRHILRCIDYIENHLHYAITLEDLAEHVSLNTNYLSTLFKKELGKTVSEYIITRRLDEAKRMLAHSEMPISEISNTLAFNSQSYFSLLFREHFNETPRQYRNRAFRIREQSERGDR